MRSEDSCLYLNPADRAKLEEIIAGRNSPSKWVWVILAKVNRARETLAAVKSGNQVSESAH